MPLSMAIWGDHPRALSREMSSSFRGVPSGLFLSQTISPSYPTTRAVRSANSRIVESSPQPMFIKGNEALKDGCDSGL